MTDEEIKALVKAFDVLDGDQEEAHVTADKLLKLAVPAEVRDAYERAAQRIGFWYA